MKIDNLYASAWQNAIEQTAATINAFLSDKLIKRLTPAEDWDVIENIAMSLNIEFTLDGDIKEAKK